MNLTDFTDSLRNAETEQEIDSLLKNALFEGVPAAFLHRTRAFRRLREAVAKRLGIERDAVTVVGSARTGFSMDPDEFPRSFNHNSDIDVLIVSDSIFDEGWLDILTLRRVNPSHSLSVRRYMFEHQSKGYIFGGWIWPDRITSALTFGPTWFDLFRQLPSVTGLSGHEFHGRIYRTWDHAMHYHRKSLISLRNKLISTA